MTIGVEMSRIISNKEIESCLSPHVGVDPSVRARLLSVLEILRVFSDENDGLTAKEIARIIGLRCGKEPSENTILDDLRTLSENPPFGMEIEPAFKGDKRGFRCARRLISTDEAAVLVNLVKTCKYLSPDQRDSLSFKLMETMPRNKQDEVVESVYVDERQTNSSIDVFHAANVASRAIREKRSLSFKYASKRMNGTVSEYEVNDEDPVALIYSFGHYYLETYPSKEKNSEQRPKFRRLDHMKDVSIGGKMRNRLKVEELSRSVVRETSEKFDMFGDGECQTLFLRVKGSHAKYVYDAFGYDTKFEHIDEELAIGYVCLRVQLSPTFFRWLFGMAPNITLVRPQGLTWIRRFTGLSSCDEKKLVEIQDNYDEAIARIDEQIKVFGKAHGVFGRDFNKETADPSES